MVNTVGRDGSVQGRFPHALHRADNKKPQIVLAEKMFAW